MAMTTGSGKQSPFPDPDSIEQDIIRIVSAIPAQAENWTDDRSRIARLSDRIFYDAETAKDNATEGKWTEKIVEELTNLGRNTRAHGYRHHHVNVSHDLRRHNNHWTYDVIWRRVDDSGDLYFMHGVTLAAQCRWWNIGHSLDELLAIRAEHRVLISKGPSFAMDFERLAYAVQFCAHTQPGDRYLLLLFDKQTKKFESGVYIAQ